MIQLTGLALDRGGRRLFDCVDMTVFAGWKLGLTGRNGAGKSSLFALLRGELEPDAGRIERPPGWRVTAIEQDTPALERLALDHVLDGDRRLRETERAIAAAERAQDHEALARLHGELDTIDAWSAPARAAKILDGLGFSEADQRRSVAEFSGGWRMRLNLARALLAPGELLLLDEPTNHLDVDAILWLESWLRESPATVVVISHDREFLDAVVDHVAHIEAGTIRLYTGNYSAFERQRAERLAAEAGERRRIEQRRAEIHAFVARFGAKASKARQAQSRLKQLARLAELPPVEQDAPMQLGFDCSDTPGNPLLALDGVDAGYGERTVLNGVSLSIAPGARLGLLGRNGAGKSTLMKLLAGTLGPQQGQRRAAPGLRIGYFAQHQIDHLDPERSPLSLLLEQAPELGEQAARDFLGRFSIGGDFALQALGRSSGGERARVALALLAWHRPQLLLLDEPTNHLDLATREALAVALQDYAGALVLVSHDRHLLRLVCDELLLVDQGRLLPYPGDLDDYGQWLRQRLRGDVAAGPSARPTAEPTSQRPDPERRKQALRLKRELDKYERRLDQLAVQLAQRERELADPALYAPAQAPRRERLLAEHAALRGDLEAAEAAWLRAQEALEAVQAGLGIDS